MSDLRQRARVVDLADPEIPSEPIRIPVRALKWPIQPSAGWSTTSTVVATVLLIGVVVTAITCGIDPLHIIRPLPAPVSAPTETRVYVSDTAFVYAMTADAQNTLLAVKWGEAGRVYSNGTLYSTVEACAETPCSLLIRRTDDAEVNAVIRYPGLRIHEVYMNATQVVVVGSGFVGDEWPVPDATSAAATTIQRDHLGYMLMAVVYDRETLTYISSSLVIPGDAPLTRPDPPTEVEFMVGRGAMTDAALGVAVSGMCNGSWILTPQLENHTTSDTDRTWSCGDAGTLTAFVAIWSDAVLSGVWHAETLNSDPTLAALTVNVQISDTEIAVYGSHTAESEVFSIPFFVDSPAPGALPSGTSPPAVLDVAWLFGDGITTASYITRWDIDTLGLISFVPMETVSSTMYVKYRSGYMDFVTEASLLSTFTMYDFDAATLVTVGPLNDPSPDTVSPIACSWSTAAGALHNCVLMSGTADAHPAWFPGTTYASISTVTSNGDVLVPSWLHPDDSADFVYPATGFNFTNLGQTSKGLVVDVNADERCAHPTLSMVKDGATYGAYHYDGLGTVWYAASGGVTSIGCT